MLRTCVDGVSPHTSVNTVKSLQVDLVQWDSLHYTLRQNKTCQCTGNYIPRHTDKACRKIFTVQNNIHHIKFRQLIHICCRTHWTFDLRRRSTASRLLRLCVRIPLGTWKFVCCECCVLSGRGLCDELITRAGESYRL